MSINQSSVRIRWAVIFLSSLLAANCTGCRSGSSSTGLILRFIESDPQVPFDLASLVDLTPIETESRESSLDVGLWESPREEQQLAIEEGGVSLSSSSGIAALTRFVDLDAESVDVIELMMKASNLNKPRVWLLWAHAGERLSSDRQVIAKGTMLSNDRIRYGLRLHGHPEWTGRISRLKLKLASGSSRFLFESIRPMRGTVNEGQLSRIAVAGAKIDLNNELRNAIPGLPGEPIERTLTVPAGSKLRFGYGLERYVQGPVTFMVDSLSRSGPMQRLFEDTLVNGTEQPGWQNAEVDLSTLEGQQVQLRLTTASEAAIDPIEGLSFWAYPEVLFSTRGRAPPNIVLISIDTLRADRVSINGYQRSTTPNLDTWARQSAAVFHSAVAQAPWTLPSHVSMLTGINAHRHGANLSGPAAPSLKMLPDLLREVGYTTLAVTAGGILHPDYGFSQGFDRYRFWNKGRGLGEDLENGLESALEWVDEHRDRPFFLFFHTYEVHTPYRSRQPYYSQFTSLPPTTDIRDFNTKGPDKEDGFRATAGFDGLEAKEEFTGLSAEEFKEVVSAAYDSGIAYTDAQLAKLFTKLEETTLDENTIVVFTSDHGEMLGEHDLAAHKYLYDENLLVPLIIASPDGRGAGQTIHHQVRSVDIVPTILELAGLEAMDGIDGQSLVPLMEDPSSSFGSPCVAWSYAAHSNYGLSLRVDNRWKYIFHDSVWAPINGTELLYSLQPNTDETIDLASSANETAALRQQLRESYLAEASGIRVHLTNGGDSEFTGTLGGPMVNVATVKSADLPPKNYLERSHRTGFRVPPTTSYTLLLIDPTKHRFNLSLAAEGDGGKLLTFEEGIDVSTLEDAMVIALTDSGWVRTTLAGRTETYVTIEWGGDYRPQETMDFSPDEELLRQLRALGYVR